MGGYSGRISENYISRKLSDKRDSRYYLSEDYGKRVPIESGNTEKVGWDNSFDNYENNVEDFRRGIPATRKDRTVLLFDDFDDSTVVMSQAEIPSKPCLIKVSTHEIIEINKSVFRIGKEVKSVDYCVRKNNAVSRHHADIIEDNHNYYIKDMHSTNCTYVNNVEIKPGHLKKLKNGDEIMLANEPFEFYFL